MCTAKLKAPDNAAGKTLRCPKCNSPVLVESPAISDPPPMPEKQESHSVNLDDIPGAEADWGVDWDTESPTITPPPMPEKQESHSVNMEGVQQAATDWGVDWNDEPAPTIAPQQPIRRQQVGGLGGLLTNPITVPQMIAAVLAFGAVSWMYFCCGGFASNTKPLTPERQREIRDEALRYEIQDEEDKFFRDFSRELRKEELRRER